jgi:hypothetical protein
MSWWVLKVDKQILTATPAAAVTVGNVKPRATCWCTVQPTNKVDCVESSLTDYGFQVSCDDDRYLVTKKLQAHLRARRS